MVPVPNLITRLVDAAGKLLPGAWNSFFQQFVQAPPNFLLLSVGASPFLYTAKEPGYVSVTGGTVSAIVLIRGGVGITINSNVVPVGIEDSVTVTYSVLPVMHFIPSYGQNLNV